MRSEKIERIDRSLRWLWLGPVSGIGCMIVLFGVGVASGSAQLMLITSVTAAVLGSVWSATYAGLVAQRRKLAQ
ncbi:MAG: hypothetical protein QM804_07525 [Propionicimonas sp.]